MQLNMFLRFDAGGVHSIFSCSNFHDSLPKYKRVRNPYVYVWQANQIYFYSGLQVHAKKDNSRNGEGGCVCQGELDGTAFSQANYPLARIFLPWTPRN